MACQSSLVCTLPKSDKSAWVCAIWIQDEPDSEKRSAELSGVLWLTHERSAMCETKAILYLYLYLYLTSDPNK